MGLFGNHYERAGSGIAKNAPQEKRNIPLF